MLIILLFSESPHDFSDGADPFCIDRGRVSVAAVVGHIESAFQCTQSWILTLIH